jgi:hypothetical protein
MTLFDELLAILDTSEFEDLGSLRLAGADSLNGALKLKLKVFLNEDVHVSQRWDIVCRSPREARLGFDLFYDIELSRDHVLLWPHTKPIASLSFYFKDGVEDPLAVVATLHERHRELTDDWLRFERFLNASPDYPLSRCIANRYGVLAEGPAPLVEAYSEVLREYGATTSNVLPTHAPGHRDRVEWVEGLSNLSVCILGDSYVVASGFEAARLDGY